MFQGTFDLDTATPIDASALSDVLFERGIYWASGRAGLVDLVAAHKWFNLAALKGRKDAGRCARRLPGRCRTPKSAPRSARRGRGFPLTELDDLVLATAESGCADRSCTAAQVTKYSEL